MFEPLRSQVFVWTNNRDSSSFKAFVSVLALFNKEVNVTDTLSQAQMWCLVDESFESHDLNEHYQTLAYKPKVIYLASNFCPAINPKWTFFKTPINVKILHNWLGAQVFENVENNTINKIETTNHYPKWQIEAFKLKYWPNVTDYAEGIEVVQACSYMIRDWVNYNTLTNMLNESLLVKILRDAEAEDNIIYNETENNTSNKRNVETHNKELSVDNEELSKEKSTDITQKSSSDENVGMGFFKKILNRFRR